MKNKPDRASDQPQFRSASPDYSFHSLMSAIEQSKIEVADPSAAALSGVLQSVIASGRSGQQFVKSVAHHMLDETARKVQPRQVAPATPLSSSADREDDNDIDSEILVWIASHVRNNKRLKSTLM